VLNVSKFVSRLCVLATRLAISFWVGGAILFVITSVAEQRNPQFDSLIRDQLATIRFPLYYIFGWGCLGTTLVASFDRCDDEQGLFAEKTAGLLLSDVAFHRDCSYRF
jgi:hypothetical protein